MQKLLIGLAAATGLLASSALACDYHQNHVTAMSGDVERGVAMSTYDGETLPPVSEEDKSAEVAVTTPCEEGDASCAPGSE